MVPFTFVTGSPDKVAEAERILGLKLARSDIDLPEIQAVEVEDVITPKAEYAYKTLQGQPVLIEDTGLFINAWNGLPGALIKWFVQRAGPAGLCRMLAGFPDRSARAKTIVATCAGQVHLFTGEIQGRIAPAPSGEGGFGWDKIFIPDGATQTFAAMSPAEKDRYSMRRLAFEAMLAYYT